MPDGTELEIGPGDVFEIPPGHDAWVVGDSPWVSVDFEAMRTYGRSEERERDQVVASILITDIVDSTAQAVRLGDRRWREVVARHNALAERVVDRQRGQVVKTTGDGILARFDAAPRAVQAASEIAVAVAELGIAIRAGVHTGQVELLDGDVRGIAVHAAARVMSVAGPGEVLVSAATRDLLTGSEVVFDDAGLFELKGIDGARQLFRLRRASPP
jgi:class 3 adenylate cyclase